MSKIALEPNSAGTGTFTIAAPNSNTNRTLTLPDETGTVLTNGSAIPAAQITGAIPAAQITEALNATGSAPIYACRAWVNFNGTGTVAIRASGNVSSITDLGVGLYNVNFATAMPDANYSVAGTARYPGNLNNFFIGLGDANGNGDYTTTALRIDTPTHSSQGRWDCSIVNVQVFR